MVPSSNDLEALKVLLPTPPPASPSAGVDATRRGKLINNNVPSQLTQAADSVHLSPSAVKAAAQAKTLAVTSLNPVAPPRTTLVPPAQEPVAVRSQGAVSGPAAQVIQKIQPLQLAAAAKLAVNARLQAEPEVRPGRVQEASQNLASLTGNSGASNAKLAEKLLTEF